MFPLALQNVFGPPNRNCQKVKRVNAAANADLNPKHHRQAPHLGLRLHLGVRCTRSTLISGTAAPLVLIVFDMPNAKSTRRRHKIHDSNELTLPSSPRRSRWDLLVWFG